VVIAEFVISGETKLGPKSGFIKAFVAVIIVDDAREHE
jgi:hypothetical protein